LLEIEDVLAVCYWLWYWSADGNWCKYILWSC